MLDLLFSCWASILSLDQKEFQPLVGWFHIRNLHQTPHRSHLWCWGWGWGGLSNLLSVLILCSRRIICFVKILLWSRKVFTLSLVMSYILDFLHLMWTLYHCPLYLFQINKTENIRLFFDKAWPCWVESLRLQLFWFLRSFFSPPFPCSRLPHLSLGFLHLWSWMEMRA